ncbi:YheC/D like ATP-grasp [Alteribacillus bidgolensis]|uniref:YheC/D like ATP-grasp n=1 Tax=Alteribacillus bidgolensis TaxID=930129 RepID=A0A1G8KUX3_9BACI|nr:YheC/D like ATP-grasp [Alteribacillus bidgolensis]
MKMKNSRRIGIILPSEKYEKLSKKPDPDIKKMVSLYEKAAMKHNSSLCFFRIHDLKRGKKVIKGFVKANQGYKLRKVPIPPVIYKRIGHSRHDLPLLQSLRGEGKILFNFYKNNHKYNMWKIVKLNKFLAKHQPDTKMANKRTVREMLKKYKSLMIKPNRGEVGRGIMKIQQKASGKWCLYYKNNNKWKKKYFKNKLPKLLLNRIKKPHLVQETIDLAAYHGKPFDLRVSVQKNQLRKWQVSAIFVKVAKDGQFLTNMGQGATAYTLQQILKSHPSLTLEKIEKKIKTFAIKLAKHIASHKKNMADFGFDIGVSKQGIPYLIEVNHISDYPAFSIKNGKLLNREWKKVFTTPIDYACSFLS